MKVLEARFHPRSKNSAGSVVVGRVRCGEGRASIEPANLTAQAVRPFDADGLTAKLRFLVETAGPDVGGHLLTLKSDYWSFVEVSTSLGVGTGTGS